MCRRETDSHHIFSLVFSLYHEVAFIYGVHMNRRKFMVSSILWNLEYVCVFIALWLYACLYVFNVIEKVRKYEATIQSVFANYTQMLDMDFKTIYATYALIWLALTSITCKFKNE